MGWYMTIKEKILKLREDGKTYSEIIDELKCSKSTVSYYCGVGQKDKTRNRNRKNRSRQHPFVRKLQNFLSKRKLGTNQCSTETFYKQLYYRLHRFQYKGGQKMQFTVKDVLKKFGKNPTCYLTGKTIDIYDTKSYEFDHKVPLSRGGDSSLNNLGICLRSANQAKNNLLIEEFIDLCRSIVNTYDKK
jgi:5-methylcytosine-specific restriction endonuclease McrA